MPQLLAGGPARVVSLSSGGHAASDIVWDDPNYERRPYDKWEAYGQSKTANILFSVELDRRFHGRGVAAFAVHPGMIATKLGRHLSRDDFAELSARAKGNLPNYKSLEAGAATSVWAATDRGLDRLGGTYLEDCGVSERHAPWALDPASAKRLWTMSEELVGQSFGAAG
jgi:NAD(P)-dependent dehydrogenase (short-subunit alcohol dehydrogenase family)